MDLNTITEYVSYMLQVWVHDTEENSGDTACSVQLDNSILAMNNVKKFEITSNITYIITY